MLDLSAIAAEIKAAQDGAHQVEPFTGRFPDFDLDAAYAVAALVHEARLAEGARPVGRKIGFTNPDMWDKFGVREPVWAFIYDSTVAFLDGTSSGCRLDRFAEARIEPEIVFRFGAAPKRGAGLRGILDAIEWVAHGFEIVQCHFPGWKFKAPDAVADWTLHATLMIGPPQAPAQVAAEAVAALESFSLDLSCDGALVETGRGSNVLGSPLSAIAHLMEVLACQPSADELQAGEMVTTGTITTAHLIRPGETWRSELRGIALPGLTVSFS